MKGNEKQQIEQHFTVNGPADPYQRLDRSAADIKRNKQQTFDQIGKIVSGLLEHGRKQQQRQIGAQCHQVVKRKNPDQAFAEEIFGTFFRGKHDHESADTKKDVHTEMNRIMFHDTKASVVVMKNSGLVGGADTKLQAAMDLGIHVIVIDRPRVKLESHVVSSNDEFFKLWEDTNGLR